MLFLLCVDLTFAVTLIHVFDVLKFRQRFFLFPGFFVSMAGNNPGAFSARLLHSDPVKKTGWEHARDFWAFASSGNTETPLEGFAAAKASIASYGASGTMQNGHVIPEQSSHFYENLKRIK